MATPPVSSTVPSRLSQGLPLQPAVPFSRDPKARREALARQLPLQPGRKVAFHQPPTKSAPLHTKGDHGGGEGDGDTWILAVVKKCINQDKNRFVRLPMPLSGTRLTIVFE
jgi:SAGA-associated factor 29